MLITWTVLCINATAIVTANIAVEMNIANGSKAIIKEVVPHPDDHEGWRAVHSNRVVPLSRPPVVVFVESAERRHLSNYHPQPSNLVPYHAAKTIYYDSKRIRL
jgi:hypothetical protein